MPWDVKDFVSKAALIISDVPYNQKISGHVSGKGKFKRRALGPADNIHKMPL